MIEGKVLGEVRGFLKSRVILSAAELDLFSTLNAKPMGADALAKHLRLDERAVTRLLDCLVAFELLHKQDGIYGLTERAAVLSSGHPETELPMMLHINGLWETWSGLTETVRTGTNLKRRPVSDRNEHSLRDFIGAMHVVGLRLSKEIAEGYNAASFSRLLDIGGGSGTYTIAFLERNQNMSAVLFDRPEVVPMAKERIEAKGLVDRVELVGGDFHCDELPAGCDLALLSAIIHQNSSEGNLELYRRINRALVPGGKVLIRDHVMEPDRIRPAQGALFAINMLVNTEGGDTYTFEEIKDALETASFADVKMVKKGERMDCLVEAVKPR